MPLRLIHFASLIVFLLIGFDAQAYCGPATAIPAGEKLSFSLLDLPNGFRFEGVLAEPLALKANPAQLGLKPASGPQRLQAPILFDTDMASPKFSQGLKPRAAEGLPARIRANQGKSFRSIQVSEDGLLDDDGRLLRLQPAARGARFQVSEGAKVTVEAGKITLAKGATLSWSPELKDPLELALLQPARIPLGENPARPSRVQVLGEWRVAAGRKIKLRVTQDGADFKSMSPQVCFSLPGMDEHRPATAIAQFVPDSIAGATADYEVVIPKELRSNTNRWWSLTPSTFATIHIVGFNRESAEASALAFNAQTTFKISNAHYSLTASLLVLALILMLSGMFLGTYRPLGILVKLLEGRSGGFSLSNLQILMWTLLVLFSLTYVWINQGEMMALTQGILALLGISSGTSVLARVISPATGGGAAPAPTPAPDTDGASNLKALLQSEDGQFDLLRFQMLGFTVFTWLYALVSVIRTDFFPEIPENLYYLMGLSSAAYLAGKTQAAAPKKADPAAGFIPTQEQLRQLQTKLGAPVSGTMDPATVEAIKKQEAALGIVPANGNLTQALYDKIMGAA